MLKVSFSINQIQNTLQRDYCRGQTIWPLEQNVLVDRWNQKESFLWNIIKVIKDNMGQTVFSIDQESKIATFFFN